MKRMSKILAVITAFIIIISMFVLPANAANVNYYCTSACGEKDSIITVSVKVSSGVSLWGTMVSLNFDSSELQYVSSHKGDLVVNGSLNVVDSQINFAGQLNTSLSINGGTIFTAKFKILKDLGISTLRVVPSSLSGDHITNEGEIVSVNSTNGEINIFDYDTLIKIAILEQIPTNEQVRAGDVYQDGTIDGFDVVCFDLFLNGYFYDNGSNSDDSNDTNNELDKGTTIQSPVADLQYSISNVSGYQGEIITVSVEMSSGIPLWGTMISLEFDSSELQYVSSSKGDIVVNGSLNSSNSKVSFAGMLNTDLSINGGTIFTVDFLILKDSGYSVLTVTPSSNLKDHITGDGETVTVEAVNGKVIIL